MFAIRNRLEAYMLRWPSCAIILAQILIWIITLDAAQAQVQPSLSSLSSHGYKLVWSDEFEGGKLNEQYWRVQEIKRVAGVGKKEAVEVNNGVATLSVFTSDNQHITGFLATDGKVSAKFGFFEAKLKMNPRGPCFQGFWLQSPSIGNPQGAPAEAGTEIDIVEYQAVDRWGRDTSNSYKSAVHWDGYGKEHQYLLNWNSIPKKVLPLQNEWHIYAVRWSETEYEFFVDGHSIWKTDQSVSKRSESIRLSCEVSDKWGLGSVDGYDFGTKSETATGMQVDWVRIWQNANGSIEITKQ